MYTQLANNYTHRSRVCDQLYKRENAYKKPPYWWAMQMKYLCLTLKCTKSSLPLHIVIGTEHEIFGARPKPWHLIRCVGDRLRTLKIIDTNVNSYAPTNIGVNESPQAAVCRKQQRKMAKKQEAWERERERVRGAERWWIKMISMFSNWWTFFTDLFCRNVTKGIHPVNMVEKRQRCKVNDFGC